MSEEIQKRATFVRMPDGSIRAVTQANPAVVAGAVHQTVQQPAPPIGAQSPAQTNAAYAQPPRQPVSGPQPRTNAISESIAAPIAQKPSPTLARAPIFGARQPATNPQTQSANASTKEIAISLALPKVSVFKPFKRLFSAIKQLFHWQFALASAVVVLALIGWFVAVPYFHSHQAGETAQTVAQAVVSPTFKTLAPNGALTATVSKAITYDQSKKVASFEDTINGVQITVSMQPLPDSVKSDVSANVQKIAEGFAANTKLPVSNGGAYLGTSEKGPQSVVAYKNNLLVFMYSATKIDQQAWTNYFNALK